jgi:hypothetical protein
LLLLSGNAFAAEPEELATSEAPPPAPSVGPRGWSIGGGPQMASLRGQECSTCDHGTYAGFFLAPRYRVSSVTSLGILGAYGWRPGSQGFYVSDQLRSEERRQLWRFGGEIILHGNKTAADPGVWFGLEYGIAGARSSLSSAANGKTTDTSNTLNGPLLGLGLGFDIPVSGGWALGAETRALAIFFTDNQFGTNPIRGTTTWLTLGANLTYRFWD